MWDSTTEGYLQGSAEVEHAEGGDVDKALHVHRHEVGDLAHRALLARRVRQTQRLPATRMTGGTRTLLKTAAVSTDLMFMPTRNIPVHRAFA